MKAKIESYNDLISKLYFKYDGVTVDNIRTVTFQVTNQCNLCCSYCYEINKSTQMMTKQVAREGIDLMFKMYEEDKPDTFINKTTKAIILDFIGGEPLLNMEVIDYATEYFLKRCIEEDHPWTCFWRANITSNGTLFFRKDVQDYFKKFWNLISFSVTVDGPKEIHDRCRVDHDGNGSFDMASKAEKAYADMFKVAQRSTKVTIAPENLEDINKVVDYFIENEIYDIRANCAFEPKWTIEHAKVFYRELKTMAKKMLAFELAHPDIPIWNSLFDEVLFVPMLESDNRNYCGGTGDMLAFDPDGIAYPCLRYMPSSLGDSVKPIVVGNTKEIYTKEYESLYKDLGAITRRSQSTDECFDCPVARGCAYCSAWNYQENGSPNIRSINICWMHRARALANVFYWNTKYRMRGRERRLPLYLPKNLALQIIDNNEYDNLLKLTYE